MPVAYPGGNPDDRLPGEPPDAAEGAAEVLAPAGDPGQPASYDPERPDPAHQDPADETDDPAAEAPVPGPDEGYVRPPASIPDVGEGEVVPGEDGPVEEEPPW
jgi:hypothetical protein